MKKILLITGLIASLFSATAFAVTADLLRHTIPAAACQPYNAATADKLYLSTNGWNFVGGQTGVARLYCSLPLSIFAGDIIFNNNDITTVRVAYRDTDGMLGNARVWTRMYSRTTPGLTNWHKWYDSNSSPITVYTNGWAGGTASRDINWYDFQGAYIYMYRANTTEYPVFVGIDFLSRPVQ